VPAKQGPAKKTSAAKQAPAKKASAKKTPAKKTPAKKTPAAKKPAATPAKKPAPKKTPATKAVTSKAAPVKKAAKKAAKKVVKTAAAKQAAATKTATKTATKVASKKATVKKVPTQKPPARPSPTGTTTTKQATTKKAAPRKAGSRAVTPGSLVVLEAEDPWTKAELKEVRAQLNDDVKRLTGELVEVEEDLAGMIENSGEGAGNDQADVGSASFERDQEMVIVNNARDMLEQSQHALERIADGTYGQCEICGNPIGKNRLMAFPRATLCLSCKQREERR
jgi:RNA polymerase-binding protein DksA